MPVGIAQSVRSTAMPLNW